MVSKQKLNNKNNWTERDVEEYDEYVIQHTEYPIEIVVEVTGSNAGENENWETWLHIKKESFETEVPQLLFDETFEHKMDAVVFAREMAYKNGIFNRIDE